MSKCRLFSPSRFWTNITGPGEVSLISKAASNSTGDNRTSKTAEPTISITRLITTGQPSRLPV